MEPMPQRKRTQQRESSRTPVELLSPVNPEEFKFCVSLAEAARGDRMPSARPTGTFDLKGQEYQFADVPHNRVLMAIAIHFKETRSDPWSQQYYRDLTSMTKRVLYIGDFLKRCAEANDPRTAPFITSENGKRLVEDALIAAGATAKADEEQLDEDSLFSIAAQLLAKGGHTAADSTNA